MPRRRSRRTLVGRLARWTLAIALLLLIAGSVLAVVGWRLTRAAPQWWTTIDPEAQSTIDAAEAVENDLANEMHRADRTPIPGIRDHWTSEPWSFAIRGTDANAWLGVRLRAWIANREPDLVWPDPLEQIQVDFANGLIRVGIELRGEGLDQIIALTLVPEIRDDGALWLRVRTIHLGRLLVPAGLALDQLSGRLGELGGIDAKARTEIRRIVGTLTGKEPLVADPVVQLSDGRLVRLLAITPRDGRIDITCQTLAPR